MSKLKMGIVKGVPPLTIPIYDTSTIIFSFFYFVELTSITLKRLCFAQKGDKNASKKQTLHFDTLSFLFLLKIHFQTNSSVVTKLTTMD